MRRVVFASHGNLSVGMKDTVQRIAGPALAIDTLAAFTDDVPLPAMVADVLDNTVPGQEVLVFTDLLGGSVNQAFLPYIQRPGVFVVSGMFLGLVLELVLLPAPLTREAIDAAIEKAKGGVLGMWNANGEAARDDE